jgi:hypothetical protein
VKYRRDMIPMRFQRHGEDSSLTRAPALCQNIKCSGRGSGCGRGKPARASSEAEFHPRGRPALERGGIPPEGVSGPRARWSLGGMVVHLSSEVEFHPRGTGAGRFGGPLRLLGPWAPATGL